MAVSVDDLLSPYSDIARIVQDETGWSIDEIIQRVGYFPVDRAMTAADHVNGVPADWPRLLHRVAVRDVVGSKLERASQVLRRGDLYEPSELVKLARQLAGDIGAVETADNVKSEQMSFRKTFWHPIDAFVGGIPKAGLTVIGAPPGVGKTSLLVKMAAIAARNGKKSLLFSMEMTGSQLKHRMLATQELTSEEQKLISISDDILMPSEVASIAALTPDIDDLWFIGIDFAELMMVGGRDNNTEAIMGRIYLDMSRMAKYLRIPIVLLSQLNRNYQGGLPQITHLRYSGMAEAVASLILLIYNRKAIFVRQDSGGALPDAKDKAWLIVGKSRYGHNTKYSGRFAIQVGWTGKGGWGDTGAAFPL